MTKPKRRSKTPPELPGKSKADPPQYKREVMHEGRFLRLIREGHWEYAQRTNTPGAVGVIGITKHRELILVRQYRIPVHRHVIEIPAGLVGDEAGQADEPLAEAARRELLEETGYRAESFEVLVETVASAGLSDESTTLVMAHGLERVEQGGGVEHEQIEVHPVPMRKVAAWIRGQLAQGDTVDPKVYAAMYFAQARGRRR
jgi:ADP-ribose pyrophosphatase